MIIKFLKVTLLIGLLVFTGCSQNVVVEGTEKNKIETEIKELIAKYKSQTDGKIDISYNLLVKNLDQKTDETKNDFNLDGKLDLQFEQTDEVTKNTNFNLNVLANFAGAEMKGLVEAEMRVLDSQLYLNLTQIPEIATENMNTAMLSSFLGKWYVFPLENNPMIQNSNFLGTILNSQTFNTQTEQDIALNELYMNTVFYDSIKVVSQNDKEQVYEVSFDKNVVFNYLIEAAKIKKEPMTEDEIAELKKVIDTLDLNMIIKFMDEDLTSVVLNFSVTLTDDSNVANELSGEVTMSFSNELESALFEVPQEVNKLF